jgi:hypothetical protein
MLASTIGFSIWGAGAPEPPDSLGMGYALDYQRRAQTLTVFCQILIYREVIRPSAIVSQLKPGISH